MPILARKSDWQKQLRQTTAAQTFRTCRPDEFPLQQVQELTTRLLSTFGRRDVPPQSKAADEVLLGELDSLKNELYIYEAAVVGCVHLFTFDLARGHLSSRIKPDLATAGSDTIFDTRVSIYLQCIILSRRADSNLVHEAEAIAAHELLGILHAKVEWFPSALKLLFAVTDSDCGELLPIEFINRVLNRTHYREKLSRKLELLRKSRQWVEAYRLVGGLRDLYQRPSLRQLLPEICDHYPMWAQWRPNLARVETWENKISGRQRSQLGRVFDLEGPDTTPQQRAALRFSSAGAFSGSRGYGLRQGKDILDHLLDMLDRAIAIGPHAIDLFIGVCLSIQPLSWHSLEHIESGLELRQDSVAKTLVELFRVLQPGTGIRDRMVTFTMALGLLNTSPRLQDSFGISFDLAVRSPKALSNAQKHFCDLLQANRPAEAFGLDVRALGRALLSSSWLHERWKLAFVEMLKGLPSEEEIRARFTAIRTADGHAARQAQMDYLAVQLGGSDVTGQDTPVLAPPVVIEDAIWRAPVDVDRDNLRKSLRGIRGLDLALATSCLKTSQAEYDGFVREMTSILGGDSDQMCVNLARFLGPRAVPGNGSGRQVHECWKGLLLHIMRQRPPGLLERLGVELGPSSWDSWIGNLRRLFGDRHLGPEGRLGFTVEKINRISQRKMGVGRMHSTSTCSTWSGS